MVVSASPKEAARQHAYARFSNAWNLISWRVPTVNLWHIGLGSNNLLFMACELLLLGKEPDGLPLLLIEELEVHIFTRNGSCV